MFRLRDLRIFLFLLPIFSLGEYWQQKVIYDIDVTLIDSLHQISGSETLTYINNSPDELEMIWMHLWPNAYRNNESALARQKFDQFSTRMHFWPDSSLGWIEVSDVRGDGDLIQWEYRSEDTLDVAKFMLNEPLAPGDTVMLDLNFTVKAPNVSSRMGHFGNHYEFTQWYPKPAVYDHLGWHPISYLDMGEFYSEWGDYEVTITLPSNYRVAATGVLQDSSEIAWRDSLAAFGQTLLDSLDKISDPEILDLDTLLRSHIPSSPDTKTITFKQENVHDFAWFTDKRFLITTDSTILPSGRSVQAWTYILPKNFVNYRYSNDYTKDALQAFSKWFLEYPYAHATVVDGDFSAGGGMEYPMITLVNNTGLQPMLEQTIAHEVGHNWFYGLAGSNERDNPWMDEGFVTYAEGRYWADKYPENHLLAHQEEAPGWLRSVNYVFKGLPKATLDQYLYFSTAGAGIDQAADLHSEDYSYLNYGAIVYFKVSLATQMLHHYLGESLMDSVWQTYFDQWAFKHPQPEDVRSIFEEVSGENLDWFFDDLIGSNKKMDLALIDHRSQPAGSGYETTVEILNKGQMVAPVPVVMFGEEDQESIVWVKPGSKAEEFTFTTTYPVKRVILDPERWTLDIDPENNDRALNLEMDLFQLPVIPDGSYQVATLPYLWYNTVDEIYPGIIFTRKHLLPTNKIDWYLRAFYGPKSEKAGFTASALKRIFPKPYYEFNLFSRLVRNWSYSLVEVNSTHKRKDPRYTSDESAWTFRVLATDISDGNLILNADTVRYMDPQIWENDRYLNGSVEFYNKTRRTLWNGEFQVTAELGARENGKMYGKLKSHRYHRKRYASGEGSIRMNVYAGITFGDLPNQERFYISTDMNPALDSKVMVVRSDSWSAPGHLSAFTTDYTIPGYAYDKKTKLIPSTTGILAGRVELDIPKVQNLSIISGLGVIESKGVNDFELIGSITTSVKFEVFRFLYTPITIVNNRLDVDGLRFQIGVDFSTVSIGLGI